MWEGLNKKKEKRKKKKETTNEKKSWIMSVSFVFSFLITL